MEENLSRFKDIKPRKLVGPDQCGLSVSDAEIIAESFERAANKKRKSILSKIFFSRTK